MPQKYFALTIVGAALLGAVCAPLFYLVIIGQHEGGMWFMRSEYSNFVGFVQLLSVAQAAAFTSGLSWAWFVVLPNQITIKRGILAGIMSACAAIFVALALLDFYKSGILPHGGIFLDLLWGIFGIAVIALKSLGGIFLLPGIVGWLYVLLVRKVFSVHTQVTMMPPMPVPMAPPAVP